MNALERRKQIIRRALTGTILWYHRCGFLFLHRCDDGTFTYRMRDFVEIDKSDMDASMVFHGDRLQIIMGYHIEQTTQTADTIRASLETTNFIEPVRIPSTVESFESARVCQQIRTTCAVYYDDGASSILRFRPKHLIAVPYSLRDITNYGYLAPIS